MVLEDFMNNVPKYEEFTYWAEEISKNNYSVFKKKDRNILIGTIKKDEIKNDDYKYAHEEWYKYAEEDLFKLSNLRPERLASEPSMLLDDGDNHDTDYLINEFEERIVAAIFIRAQRSGQNPDESLPVAMRFLNWIRNTDFYTCPASTRFHDAIPSGLLYHSLNVFNNMIDLKKLNKFRSVPYDSIVLTSLCHDFTKIGNYESYMRNVKNETTGQWEQVPSYRWHANPFPFGHGVSSMYIVSKFINLSMEEMLAIRWHMGAYSVSPREEVEFFAANEQYPLVRMLQFADQLACVDY